MTAGQLLELVELFSAGHPLLSKPRYASGKCYGMSWQFIKMLEERGWSCLVQIIEADGENPGREFQTCLPPRRFVNHYAVLLPTTKGEGVVIDFTARQFGQECDFPWMADLSEWKDFMSSWLEANVNTHVTRYNIENFYINGGASRHAAYC